MSEWNYRGGITAILRDFSSELPLRWNRVGGITETIFLSAYVIPPRVRLCDSTQVLCLSGIIVVELRAKSNFGNKGTLANRTATDVVRQLNFW